MDQEVYADLLFLINASMDGLCFCLSGRILHRPLPPLRTVLASILGGLYAVAALFLPVGQAAAFLIDAAVCFGLCSLVFASRKGRPIRQAGLCTVVFLAVSMAVGGIMTALFNLLNHMGVAERLPDATTEDGPSAWLFLLLAAVAGICAAAGGRFLRRSTAVRVCRVVIEMDGRTVTLDGMTDSGNLMRDPVSGFPVVAVDRDAIRPLLSPRLQALFRQSRPDLASLSLAPEGRRVRLVPCATATGQEMLVVVLPDRLWIVPESDSPHEVRALFAPTPLSSKPHTQALVPSELML